MNDPPFAVVQERDRVPGPSLVLALAVGLLVGAVGVTSSVLLGGGNHPPKVPPRASAQIGMLEQTLISETERGLALRRSQRQRLEQYRYLDRDAGVVEIPIERAMELKLSEPR